MTAPDYFIFKMSAAKSARTQALKKAKGLRDEFRHPIPLEVIQLYEYRVLLCDVIRERYDALVKDKGQTPPGAYLSVAASFLTPNEQRLIRRATKRCNELLTELRVTKGYRCRLLEPWPLSERFVSAGRNSEVDAVALEDWDGINIAIMQFAQRSEAAIDNLRRQMRKAKQTDAAWDARVLLNQVTENEAAYRQNRQARINCHVELRRLALTAKAELTMRRMRGEIPAKYGLTPNTWTHLLTGSDQEALIQETIRLRQHNGDAQIATGRAPMEPTLTTSMASPRMQLRRRAGAEAVQRYRDKMSIKAEEIYLRNRREMELEAEGRHAPVPDTEADQAGERFMQGVMQEIKAPSLPPDEPELNSGRINWTEVLRDDTDS
jgi:hypothetical protein